MNNTMKNLKDEIEGILFKNNNHLLYQDGWGNEPESYGSEISFDQVSLRKAVEALTSLIEQEKEMAVMGFIDYMYGQNLPLHKAGVVTVRAFAKQYLAERKGE